MEQLIDKARERLSAIEAEAEELRTFIRVYQGLTGNNDVDKAVDVTAAEADSAPSATPAEIVESAREAMRERGRPLTRTQILKALRDKGLNLPGKDATKNIGTVIWRSKRFDNIAGYGYWPKDFVRWMGQRVREPDLPLP